MSSASLHLSFSPTRGLSNPKEGCRAKNSKFQSPEVISKSDGDDTKKQDTKRQLSQHGGDGSKTPSPPSSVELSLSPTKGQVPKKVRGYRATVKATNKPEGILRSNAAATKRKESITKESLKNSKKSAKGVRFLAYVNKPANKSSVKSDIEKANIKATKRRNVRSTRRKAEAEQKKLDNARKNLEEAMKRAEAALAAQTKAEEDAASLTSTNQLELEGMSKMVVIEQRNDGSDTREYDNLSRITTSTESSSVSSRSSRVPLLHAPPSFEERVNSSTPTLIATCFNDKSPDSMRQASSMESLLKQKLPDKARRISRKSRGAESPSLTTVGTHGTSIDAGDSLCGTSMYADDSFSADFTPVNHTYSTDSGHSTGSSQGDDAKSAANSIAESQGDAESVANSIAYTVATTISKLSISKVPCVKESQPLGGPKYYVATINGQAKIVHEAMPFSGDGASLGAVAEERGFEVVEYDLVKKKDEGKLNSAGSWLGDLLGIGKSNGDNATAVTSATSLADVTEADDDDSIASYNTTETGVSEITGATDLTGATGMTDATGMTEATENSKATALTHDSGATEATERTETTFKTEATGWTEASCKTEVTGQTEPPEGIRAFDCGQLDGTAACGVLTSIGGCAGIVAYALLM